MKTMRLEVKFFGGWEGYLIKKLYLGRVTTHVPGIQNLVNILSAFFLNRFFYFLLNEFWQKI